MRRVLAGLGLVTACALGAGLGAYAGSRDVHPVNTTPVTVPTWADPGSPPADPGSPPAYPDERWQDPSGLPYCLADGSPQDMLPCVDAQTGAVTTSPLDDAQAEGATVYELAQLTAYCVGDPVTAYPCLLEDEVGPVYGADGDEHTGCVLLLTTAEDSAVVCNDDTVWPS